MIIKGQSIYLRTVREADLEVLFIYNNELEQRGEYYPIAIDSEVTIKENFRKSGFLGETGGTVLICDLEDAVLGQMNFFKSTPYYDGFEVGYRVYNPAERGRGIMTEALMLFSYTLFAWKPINRLELKIDPANRASVRVAEKCGYQLEGVARQSLYFRGKHHNMAIYSLLRNEAPTSLEETLARLERTRAKTSQT